MFNRNHSNTTILNKKPKPGNKKVCLEKIKKLIIEDPSVISDVVSPNKEDIDGIKTLILSFPNLLKILPPKDSRALSKIYGLGEIMNKDRYANWAECFEERCEIYFLRKGINKKNDDGDVMNQILKLSNLDLCLLVRKINDPGFNCFLYKSLSVERLKVIFGHRPDFELIHSSYDSTLNHLQEKAYLKEYLDQLEYSRHKVVPPKKVDFFCRVIQCVSAKMLRENFLNKSPYVVALIMVELDEAWRLKVFNTLSSKMKEEVSELFIGGKQELRDGKVLERVIREIELYYHQGAFKLIHGLCGHT